MQLVSSAKIDPSYGLLCAREKLSGRTHEFPRTRVGYDVGLNVEIRLIPDRPDTNEFQKSLLPIPIGDTIPTPVITTRQLPSSLLGTVHH